MHKAYLLISFFIILICFACGNDSTVPATPQQSSPPTDAETIEETRMGTARLGETRLE